MRSCESEEMYLETIYLLGRRNAQVRRVDIAAELGVSKPSVTSAVRALCAKGYVCKETGAQVRLTDEGTRRAGEIYERHHLLTQMFLHIGATPADAEENACRMEHVVSATLMDVIRQFVNGTRASRDV